MVKVVTSKYLMKKCTDSLIIHPLILVSNPLLIAQSSKKPLAIDLASAVELRYAVDDAIKEMLVEEFKYTEDLTMVNIRLLLGYIASIAAIGGSLYGYLTSFESSKLVVFVSVLVYFLSSSALNFYEYLVKKDTIFVGTMHDPTGLETAVRVTVDSKFEKYSDRYKLVFAVAKASGGAASVTTLDKSYGDWFDQDGFLVDSVLLSHVHRVLADNKLHLS